MTTQRPKTIALLLPSGGVVPILPLSHGRVVEACAKCTGTGYIAHFGYHDEGVCYGCGGQGYKDSSKIHDSEGHLVEYLEKRRARREAQAAKEHAEWLAAAPAREAAAQAAKAEEEARELARQAALDEQTYLDGAVGDRVVFSGTVKVSKSFDGHFGPSVLTVVAVGASEVKFFSTAKFAWALSEGDEVTLSAEISGFEVYGSAKQTVVKRAKLA